MDDDPPDEPSCFFAPLIATLVGIALFCFAAAVLVGVHRWL